MNEIRSLFTVNLASLIECHWGSQFELEQANTGNRYKAGHTTCKEQQQRRQEWDLEFQFQAVSSRQGTRGQSSAPQRSFLPFSSAAAAGPPGASAIASVTAFPTFGGGFANSLSAPFSILKNHTTFRKNRVGGTR